MVCVVGEGPQMGLPDPVLPCTLLAAPSACRCSCSLPPPQLPVEEALLGPGAECCLPPPCLARKGPVQVFERSTEPALRVSVHRDRQLDFLGSCPGDKPREGDGTLESHLTSHSLLRRTGWRRGPSAGETGAG